MPGEQQHRQGLVRRVASARKAAEHHARRNTGLGPGSFETECHAPLFAIHDTATLFPKAGTVQLQITDSSTVFDIQIDGALADHAITLATPHDGKVHVGQPATLLLPVTTETIGSAKVYLSSAANESLYGFDSHTQELQIADGKLAFAVPSTLTPQPVKVTVSARLSLATPVCTGPSECSATFVIGVGAPYAVDGTPDPPLALATDLVP